MAYGRKNKVKTSPLDYNILLLGEPKIGKTTLIYEMCKKLAGEDGYLFGEMGSERGADAIEGVNYVDIPCWDDRLLDDEDLERMDLNNQVPLMTLIDDICENKSTAYPDLKVFIVDTIDHFIDIANAQTIVESNRELAKSVDKKGKKKTKAKTINEAFGGFHNGQKYAMSIMGDVINRLLNVGVHTILIGHTKFKEVVDPISDTTYQVLTSNQPNDYYKYFENNMHFVATAYIDREIINKKNSQDKDVGKVQSETRKIKFRDDDSYAVNSGSRFKTLKSEINFDVDEFINAIVEAIKNEKKRGGGNFDKDLKEEKVEKKKAEEIVKKKEENEKVKKQVDTVVDAIISFISNNSDNLDLVKDVKKTLEEIGLVSPKDINNLADAKKLWSVVKKYK